MVVAAAMAHAEEAGSYGGEDATSVGGAGAKLRYH